MNVGLLVVVATHSGVKKMVFSRSLLGSSETNPMCVKFLWLSLVLCRKGSPGLCWGWDALTQKAPLFFFLVV